MRLPRFRLRTLMIAVAVVALPFGGLEEYHRQSYCRDRIAHHARAQRVLEASIVHQQLRMADEPKLRPMLLRDVHACRYRIAWHARVEETFRRSLWRPWELIHDPPEFPLPLEALYGEHEAR
jgi:hypothetical protein